jgi:hypothetical protein
LIEKRSARSKSKKKNRKRGNAVNAPRFIASAAAVLIRPGGPAFKSTVRGNRLDHFVIRQSKTILAF